MKGTEFRLLIGTGSEDDHGHAASGVVFTDASANFDAIHLRHHVVEQGELRTSQADELQGFGTIRRLDHVDVLKLQPDEERTIEALLARASDEARAHRRQGQAVHRLENGSIDITDKEADWADFLRTESSRLKDALDDESAAALQAVGLKQLLTSAHMMGLAGADLIPGQPGEMLVRVRNDGLILHQRISREALETLLAP